MLDGCNGSRWMPRKMAGNEMITMDWLSIAMNTPSVVFDRTTQRARPSAAVGTPDVPVTVTPAVYVNVHFTRWATSSGTVPAGRIGLAGRRARYGDVLTSGHASIRTVHRTPVRRLTGRSLDGRRTALRRDRPRGAGPPGGKAQRERRTGGAPGTRPPGRPRPVCQRGQADGGVAEAGHPAPRPFARPLRLPHDLARRTLHQRCDRRRGHRRPERRIDLPPRADLAQGEDRPARAAPVDQGQSLPHLGPVPERRAHRALRAERSARYGGRGRRRGAPRGVGPRRFRDHRRRPRVGGGLPTGGGRRPPPVRDGPHLPSRAGPTGELVSRQRAGGGRPAHGPGGRTFRGATRCGSYPPGALGAPRRARPGRRVCLLVRGDPGR